jgi:hypothetical protein
MSEKKSDDKIMTTFADDGKDVAEPDQIVSGMAGTGQMNRSWMIVSSRLGAVNIGELDMAFCTTTRWLRHLQRQVTRLDMRKKAVLSKRPVIRTEVW